MIGIILLWAGCAIGIVLLATAAWRLHLDDLDGWAFVLVFLGLVFVIFGAAFGGAKTWERAQCGYASTQYQLPTRWTFWYGCYIKAGNRYVSLDQYRAFINGGGKP